jgi:hypothetical protein
MPEQIQLTLQAQASGGPQLTVGQLLQVDAYDKIQVTINAKTGGAATVRKVKVLPAATKVRLLMITASSYSPALSYKGSGTGNPAINLDGPLLLVGAGAAGAYNAGLEEIEFTNNEAAAYEVEILIGRDTTP